MHKERAPSVARWEAVGLLKRKEDGKRASAGVARFFIPRESGGGPVYAPSLIRAVAVSACRLAVWSFTLFTSDLHRSMYVMLHYD